MDTSSPAALVNAELMKMYSGRRVRTVVQVLRVDSGMLTGQSPDGQQIVIKSSPAFPLSRFVEVIGIVDGSQSIRAEICTDFGDNFGKTSFPTLSYFVLSFYESLISICLLYWVINVLDYRMCLSFTVGYFFSDVDFLYHNIS